MRGGNLYANSEVTTGNRPLSEDSQYSSSGIYMNANNVGTHRTRVSGTNTAGSRSSRPAAVCLGLLCVLLLAAIIVLCVKFTADKDWLPNSYNNDTSCQNKLAAIDLYTRQGWIYFSSKVYSISPETKNWTDSRQACIEKQADLVIINSAEEQKFLAEIVGTDHSWIGLTDTEKEGVWKWVDGTKLTTRYWNVNEPNNLGNRENCAETGFSDKKGWNDVPCDAERVWICEKHAF